MRKLVLAVATMAIVLVLLNAGSGSLRGQTSTPTPTPTATPGPGPNFTSGTFVVDTTGSDQNSCLVASNPVPALAPPSAIVTLFNVANPVMPAAPATLTLAPPEISPTGGPVEGGTKVTITGSGFVGNSQVFFGFTPAQSVQVVNGQLIYAVAPPAPVPEYVTVTVQNPQSGGTSVSGQQFVNIGLPPPPTPPTQPTIVPAGFYAYGFNPLPVVSQLFPNAGPASGGTLVMIRGYNFEPNAEVSFGPGNPVAAANVTVLNGFEIQVTAPPDPGPGPVDVVDVTVTNPGFDGQPDMTSPTLPGFGTYTYGGAPTLPSSPPDPIVPAAAPQGPCGTIQGAVNLTRDRDGVQVDIGTYVVNQPIEVDHTIAVFGEGFGQTDCKNKLGLNKIVLRSGSGQPLFHITAPGSGVFGTLIAGFIMGGVTSFTNPGAIQLDGDSYTEVRCNLIGQEDLPNVIGILLRDSDHAYIHDNQIRGSSQFPISATLSPTPPVGGFGIVTAECLGASSRTDDATVQDNLFAFNSNGALYFCSDGSGGDVIQQNSIRDNGRGIVLSDANDMVVTDNVVQDNYYDGAEILGTSENNNFNNNTIESQEGPLSSGILLEGDGLLFPLLNVFTNNQLRRNTTNVFIAGARATRFTGNFFTAEGERADIVFALGNPSGQALNSANPEFAQPTSTLVHGNTLLANGPCSANRGCAIRLMAGVTTSIDATTNDFGVTRNDEIRAEIWDKYHDPALGEVVTYQQQNVPVTPTVPPTVAPITPAPLASPPVAVNEIGLPSPVATAPPVSTPVATSTPAITSTPATPSPAPPASEAPVTYIDPATGNYYVTLTLCVTGASGQIVPNDQLMISFFDSAGNALGSAAVVTDSQGCFSGNVAAPGPGAAIQPASITVSDPSGATTDLTVTPGTPLMRSPGG